MKSKKSFNYAYKGKIYSHNMFTDYADFSQSFKHSLCLYNNQKLFYPLKENCPDSVLNFAINGKRYGITNRIMAVGVYSIPAKHEYAYPDPTIYLCWQTEDGKWHSNIPYSNRDNHLNGGMMDIAYSPKLDVFSISGITGGFLTRDGITKLKMGAGNEAEKVIWSKDLALFCYAYRAERAHSIVGLKTGITISYDGIIESNLMEFPNSDFITVTACDGIGKLIAVVRLKNKRNNRDWFPHSDVYTSSDGINWHKSNFNDATQCFWCEHLQKLIIASRGELYMSTDLVTFQKVAAFNHQTEFREMAYSPQLKRLIVFISQGTWDNSILYSSDGTTWHNHFIGFNIDSFGLCWDSFTQEFIAYPSYSKDGLNWVRWWEHNRYFCPLRIAQQIVF